MIKSGYITQIEYEKLLLKYKDKSRKENLKNMNYWMERGFGVVIKFVCQYCGSRQFSDFTNFFRLDGSHCKECGEFSRPERFGFGIMKEKSKLDKRGLDFLKDKGIKFGTYDVDKTSKVRINLDKEKYKEQLGKTVLQLYQELTIRHSTTCNIIKGKIVEITEKYYIFEYDDEQLHHMFRGNIDWNF